MLLSVEQISKEYDGVRALNRVSLGIKTGTIKGLTGPNGAGKTTLFHLISGFEQPTSGKILFRGQDITSKKAHEIAALGLGRTFQTTQAFGNMTVVDNILTGMNRRLGEGYLSCGFRLPRVKRTEDRALKEAKEILDWVGLLGRWEWPASQISYAEQKMLEMGRAIAMKPELLLLDEPAAGLTPFEIGKLAERILCLRKEGMTIFIVEHHMAMVLEIADEIAVLHNGELLAEGPPEAIRKDQKVIGAYLRKGAGKARE